MSTIGDGEPIDHSLTPLHIRDRDDFDIFWARGVDHAHVRPFDALTPPLSTLVIEGVNSTEPTRNAPEHAGTPDDPDASSVRTFPSDLDDIDTSHREQLLELLREPPITAQVWWAYATQPRVEPIDLLVDPTHGTIDPDRPDAGISARSAMSVIQEEVIWDHVSLEYTRLANSFGFLALSLTLDDMLQRLVNVTSWRPLLQAAMLMTDDQRSDAMVEYARGDTTVPSRTAVGWFLHLLVICWRREPDGTIADVDYDDLGSVVMDLRNMFNPVLPIDDGRPYVGRVTLNRRAVAAVHRSQRTVKVDATRGLFDIKCDQIRWAVVDSGIDARHRWFRRTRADGTLWEQPFHHPETDEFYNFTRVVEAYDFTQARYTASLSHRMNRGEEHVELSSDIPIALALGPDQYLPPENGHGTHVAGILGGYGGLCPDIALYDYRVLDRRNEGDEFSILMALRHILERSQRAGRNDPNRRSRDLPIHGVNLSLSMGTDVASDACGWSTICRVCDDLVRAGVVVVVAAGNTGFETSSGSTRSTGQQYRTLSITDPGNTERVITVGSTDADRPREHGISYFSARGPTADGRPKPDLVAPGNGITSSYGYRLGADDRNNVAATLNGTSMAAAHVSGCAAILLSRHRELIGKPEEIKRILMDTATDLNRDRNFQGAGLVDALRALQSI